MTDPRDDCRATQWRGTNVETRDSPRRAAAARGLHGRPEFQAAELGLSGIVVCRPQGEGAARAAAYRLPRRCDPNWWTLFHDPQLTALEQQVAGQNLDVRLATIRLAESRAQLGLARAGEFPQLNANASYTRQKASDLGMFANAPNPLGANGASGSRNGGIRGSHLSPFDIYQVGFDASWELDLWGRVRRSVESANATVQASAEARRGVLLTSLAEVARDYIQLRGVQAQLGIARENLQSAQQSLRLTQQRAAGGVTTDLDVANAAAQVRTTAAEIPLLEQREAQQINALSLLLGRPPNALRAQLAEAEAGAAGAAARAGGAALGTGAAPPRYPPGRGAAARGHREYRYRGGGLLSAGDPVRAAWGCRRCSPGKSST